MWASGSEVKDEKNHKQGLLEKATKGQKEVVSLLLKYGASPDMRDRDGKMVHRASMLLPSLPFYDFL